MAQTTIYSNGSTWYGQAEQPLEALIAVLTREPLEWATVSREFDGVTVFHGNFRTVSHVFHIETDDPLVVDQLSLLIGLNQHEQDMVSR